MVAKDEDGQPTPVPGLLITDEESLRRFAEGKALKILAMQKHKILKEEFHQMSLAEIKKSIEGERVEIQYS
jgi:acyl-CoA hydrolase